MDGGNLVEVIAISSITCLRVHDMLGHLLRWLASPAYSIWRSSYDCRAKPVGTSTGNVMAELKASMEEPLGHTAHQSGVDLLAHS